MLIAPVIFRISEEFDSMR
ncbi:uncharacterized protein FRV6_15327 [Fusarium oxysporum]|uniref:Uncharacterized protein n=1 Tax=Fusarium oxysporum TaxID=5507 RepID=A0A2H3UB96_FUSOX|nr:uncharacterized protein FRV6_15327 [Fusarium oxysporum]